MKQEIWWDAMTSNDTIRIKYASKYAGSSNYWKNSMGMNEALTNLGCCRERKLEARLAAWIKTTLSRRQVRHTLQALTRIV